MAEHATVTDRLSKPVAEQAMLAEQARPAEQAALPMPEQVRHWNCDIWAIPVLDGETDSAGNAHQISCHQ